MENNYVRSRKDATSERNFAIMGIDGMNSADIFDEYFDDEKPKYIIKNSEIEKMYENAEIKKVRQTNIAGGDYPIAVGFEDYPPFTPEKQLELIKFLFKKSVSYDVDDKDNYWFEISDDCYTYHYNKFEVALADIINELWQDLTEEEQEQIRSILNGN